MNQQQHCQTPEQHLTFFQRLRLAGAQWSRSLTFFCEVYGLALGIIFLLSAIFPQIPQSFTYDFWQEGGRIVLGLVYTVTAAYAILYPEHKGWMAATLIPAVTGIPPSLYPRINPAALCFWIIVIITFGFEINRRLDSGEWDSNAR